MSKKEVPVSDQNRVAKINSIRKAIYHILNGGGKMTATDLISCLMSEPHPISVDDLDLIAIALNDLVESDLLRVSFRVNNPNLNIEIILKTTPLRKYPKHRNPN